MRADRLISTVLLLRQRGRMTAGALARELDVSPRTVLRDLSALSSAGVPVYAERGRHGGFALLPGWDGELTGLSDGEALALLVAGQGGGDPALGLGPALSAAVRKVVEVLPSTSRATAGDAARRLLVRPDADLVTPLPGGTTPTRDVLRAVRSAVLGGRRLRLHYAADGQPPQWRTVDPIGLVTVRDRTYLLATRDGADRTYRLSRVLDAEQLADPAERPDQVDLDRLWRERCARYLAEVDQVVAVVRSAPERQEDLARGALAVRGLGPDPDGRVRAEVTYQDAQHAGWALWQLVEDVEVLAPPGLRAAVHDRAAAVAARHA